MDLPARLTAALAALPAGLAADPLAVDLDGLVAALAEAVSGYAGLELTVVHTAHPVRVTALAAAAPEPVVTSLRLPLALLAPGFEPGSRLVVLSRVAGSLVDLAADLAYALGTEAADGGAGIDLDLDLGIGATAPESGVTGLDELLVVHRAAGLLIGRGHAPGSVHQTLVQQAVSAELSTSAYARRVLEDG